MRARIVAKILFCLIPAIFLMALIGTVLPAVGLLVGVVTFCFGWDVLSAGD